MFDARGRRMGRQGKAQRDLVQNAPFVEAVGRSMFMDDGLTFGICICHEGRRYPETVAVIRPEGVIPARQPKGDAGALVIDLYPEAAIGLLTRRYRPDDRHVPPARDSESTFDAIQRAPCTAKQ